MYSEKNANETTQKTWVRTHLQKPGDLSNEITQNIRICTHLQEPKDLSNEITQIIRVRTRPQKPEDLSNELTQNIRVRTRPQKPGDLPNELTQEIRVNAEPQDSEDFSNEITQQTRGIEDRHKSGNPLKNEAKPTEKARKNRANKTSQGVKREPNRRLINIPVNTNYQELEYQANKELQMIAMKYEMLAPFMDQHQLVSILIGLLVFISLSEHLITSLATVKVGLVGHGLALIGLLLLAAFREDPKEQRIYLTLALAPLIRLVSVSMPLQGIPMIYWYVLIGTPITLSIIMVMRYCAFTRQEVGLTGAKWFFQIMFGFSGIGLGYIEYLILRPESLVDELTLRAIWFPALILLVFTGFMEEIIYRGLMQSAFTAKIGRWLGILLISFLCAVLHLGYQSLLNLMFVFLVAIVFALVTEKTGSIIGVSIAHGLTNVTLFLVFPFILG